MISILGTITQVDNRMICSGRQIELDSFDLQLKQGLISKCLYINELLQKANLNESSLDNDPVFTQNGKATLVFLNKKDAETFSSVHSSKFKISESSTNSDIERPKSFRKNVSFSSDNGYSLNISSPSDEDLNSDERRSILKKDSNNNNMITGRTKVGFNVDGEKKTKSNEAYEILTIRAKLKQRVDQNRSKQVSLGDVDQIMRNVVTIIQDEFMKRFPSGTSNANGSSTPAIESLSSLNRQ